MPRLRRADCSRPGITRLRRGRGFVYLDPSGQQVLDPEVLARIRGLVLPPAWKDVWICPYPNGHLQAVGTDAAGRRQYRYHDAWRMRRDSEKFDKMLGFARTLPKVREAVASDLTSDGLGRERVLACAIRLLDRGFVFRIGSEGYVESNDSYGLATIEKHHVTLRPDGLIVFHFRAKSGKQQEQELRDPEVYQLLAQMKRRRTGGTDLLAYRQAGRWIDVRADDVNRYLREVSGGDFTAKDYRTWSATALASVGLALSSVVSRSRTARQRAIARVIREVADYLGNTPAVCRKSYIDPRVIDRYLSGRTVIHAVEALGAEHSFGEPAFQGAVEQAIIELIEDPPQETLERIA